MDSSDSIEIVNWAGMNSKMLNVILQTGSIISFFFSSVVDQLKKKRERKKSIQLWINSGTSRRKFEGIATDVAITEAIQFGIAEWWSVRYRWDINNEK